MFRCHNLKTPSILLAIVPFRKQALFLKLVFNWLNGLLMVTVLPFLINKACRNMKRIRIHAGQFSDNNIVAVLFCGNEIFITGI